MPHSEEQNLLLRAGQGDRSAFAELVERHHPGIIRFIHRFLGSAGRDAAEDLAQDVFLSAFKAAPYYQPNAKVGTWLFRLATNACLNYRRRWRLRRVISFGEDETIDRMPARDASADIDVAEREKADAVRAAIVSLPAMQRAVIVLRHYHEFSYVEIADVMETSVSAVESLLFRARGRLKSRLVSFEPRKSPQVSPKLGAEPS